MGDQTLLGMGMTQGDGQGVGGIDLRFLGQLQQMHDHHLHLLLVCTAGPHDCLLDLRGGVLRHAQPLLHCRDDGRPPRLPQLQGRIGVARHEHLLDAQGRRAVGADHLADAAKHHV